MNIECVPKRKPELLLIDVEFPSGFWIENKGA